MDDIKLYPLQEKDFNDISISLNNDPEVNKFVNFCNKKESNGVFFNNKLIGLFTLNKFINGTLAIHIALIKEYRNKKIGSKVLNKIVEEYGKNYPEVEFFLANINYNNKIAIKVLNNLGWDKTYKYDEDMENEGGEFFIIYEKRNPYFNRKVMTYDTK